MDLGEAAWDGFLSACAIMLVGFMVWMLGIVVYASILDLLSWPPHPMNGVVYAFLLLWGGMTTFNYFME